ncbi:trypsin-like serine protease [Aliivibrio fischeri]|uniref:trypsin-like serine protease n=1 Tax=Aliivibrio fischeri TaxID=668 RepID=UPI00114D2B4D|nr:trypsin-like serine protease [Aliivibrio fischeri]
MNKWLGLILLGAYPIHSYAIENGTSMAWNNYNNDDIIKLYSADEKRNCSGTLIAGKYTLTAAHCVERSDLISKIKTARGQQYQIVTNNIHPSYDATIDNSYPDFALTELEHSIDATHIHFFADLTKDNFIDKAPIRIFGFGGTEENLHYADLTMTDLIGGNAKRLDGQFINKGNSTGGDSGGAWVNKNGRIVATHKGGKLFDDGRRETYSTNLSNSDSSNFILETINGWHYPTLAYTSNGKGTITVQSLHRGPITDSATFSGDVQIVGGTCYDGHSVTPYETCTYEIESSGGQGSIVLGQASDGTDEIIHINKPMPTSNDAEGGSLGVFGLLLLSGFGFIRKKRHHG